MEIKPEAENPPRNPWWHAPRRMVLVIVFALTVAAWFWWRSKGEPEPVYQGKPILAYFPEWIRQQAVPPGTIWFTPTGQRLAGAVFSGSNVLALTPPGTTMGVLAPWNPSYSIREIASPEAIPWLLRVIRRDDSLLKRLYQKHESRVPQVIRKWLPVPVASKSIREQALNVLTSVARRSPSETSRRLLPALESGNHYQRVAAARAMVSSRMLAEPVCRALAVNLAHPNTEVRDAAFDALIQLNSYEGPMNLAEIDDSTFAAMTRYWVGLGPIQQVDPHRSVALVRTIAHLSRKFQFALPALAELRTNTNAFVRVEATYSVWRVVPSDRSCGLGLLREFVEPIGDAKYRAGEYLARDAANMKLGAADTVPKVVAAMGKGGPVFCTQAAQILAHFGKDALPALPTLTNALRALDRELRLAAVRAIEAIGPAASNAIPALVESLNDPITQSQAAGALGAFGQSAISAVPKLAELVAKPAPFAGGTELRSNAARTLGRIGLANETVLSALREAAAESEARIRTAATEALQRIRPPRSGGEGAP